ncbi:DUF4186 family protein [Streptomyces sp. NPDC012935]
MFVAQHATATCCRNCLETTGPSRVARTSMTAPRRPRGPENEGNAQVKP